MSGSNNNKGKSFSQITNWLDAVKDWFQKEPETKNTFDRQGAAPDVFVLPDRYDNIPYISVVNSQPVSTVGEAKAAAAAWREWHGGE